MKSNHLMQILQLEKHLKDQQAVRGALEKALGPNAGPVSLSPENPMPQVCFVQELLLVRSCTKNKKKIITHQVN
jgi:hypothetical protein